MQVRSAMTQDDLAGAVAKLLSVFFSPMWPLGLPVESKSGGEVDLKVDSQGQTYAL